MQSCRKVLTKWEKIHIPSFENATKLCSDMISCLEFDSLGNLLAAGDKSGHIFIYNTKLNEPFEIYCAFTSHDAEFDYLKSLEIEERINSIAWLPTRSDCNFLLSTNTKTVKLWKISEKLKEAFDFNTRGDENCIDYQSEKDSNGFSGSTFNDIKVPKFRRAKELTVEVRPKKIYTNAHTFHINSLSTSSDQETFLSSDDLRINLWNLDVTDESFTIVDLKPDNLEYLFEVITCTRFHPRDCSLLGYGTNKGVVRLCDLRHQSLCDDPVLILEDNSNSKLISLSDLVYSLSDFRFNNNGDKVLARDFLDLKIWDLRMASNPLHILPVHDIFRDRLLTIYQEEYIFDKFLCSWSYDDRFVMSGSYQGIVAIYDLHEQKEIGNLYVMDEDNHINGDRYKLEEEMALNSWPIFDPLKPLEVTNSLLPAQGFENNSPNSSLFEDEINNDNARNFLHPRCLLSSITGLGERLFDGEECLILPRGLINNFCQMIAELRSMAPSSIMKESSGSTLSTSLNPPARNVEMKGAKRRKQLMNGLQNLPAKINEIFGTRTSAPKNLNNTGSIFVVPNLEQNVDDNHFKLVHDLDYFFLFRNEYSHWLELGYSNSQQCAATKLFIQIESLFNVIQRVCKPLDFQKKILQCAWHPQRLLFVTAFDSELQACRNVDKYLPSVNLVSNGSPNIPLLQRKRKNELSLKSYSVETSESDIMEISDTPMIENKTEKDKESKHHSSQNVYCSTSDSL